MFKNLHYLALQGNFKTYNLYERKVVVNELMIPVEVEDPVLIGQIDLDVQEVVRTQKEITGSGYSLIKEYRAYGGTDVKAKVGDIIESLEDGSKYAVDAVIDKKDYTLYFLVKVVT